MALTDPMQARLQRSVFHAIRKRVVELGYLPDIDLYGEGTPEFMRYEADQQIIQNTKGFFIEVFGVGSPRSRYEKKAPRIVINISKVYEGDLGAPPGAIHIRQTIEGVSSYRQGILPSQSSNIILSVHLLSKKSNEEILLNSILSDVIGQRGYLDFNDEPGRKFFIKQNTFNDLDDPIENFIEKAYTYLIPDVYEADIKITNANVSPIKEITIETHIPTEVEDNTIIT